MKITVEQAITMARNNESLKGMVIDNLNDTQVRAIDALVLAQQGIVLPEQNIYYDDDDIAYDPDFDEVEWRKEPIHMTWDEKFKKAAEFEKNKVSAEEVSLKINISDPEIRQWMHTHADKLGQLLGNFIAEVYKENQVSKG